MNKILIGLVIVFGLGFARTKVRPKKHVTQPGSQVVLWISPDGISNGAGTYDSPLDYTTSSFITNYYRARKDGCYSDGLCVTNPYAPPTFTNSPVADYPHFYFVELIP